METPKDAPDWLASTIETFTKNKSLADRAIHQVPDEKLYEPLDENTNSIGVIAQHVAGNLLSRWTDFLSSDGEKEWRNRDEEFRPLQLHRQQLLHRWESGWNCVFDTLRSLDPSDCVRSVTIRGEPHSVPLAISRSLGHTCYHVGQIVLVARIHCKDQWETLTIARGGSTAYNRANWGDGSPHLDPTS